MPIFDRQGHRLVTAGQAATLLGVSANAVAERRRTGSFPAPVDWVDGRTPVWREADLHVEDVVPHELRRIARWIPAGRRVKQLDADGWLTYAAAREASRAVSFVLDADGIICIKVARCLRADGSLRPAADALGWWTQRTYTEITPSGDGLVLWGCAELGGVRQLERVGVRVEALGTAAAVRVTGERFDVAPSWLADLTSLIDP